MLAANLYRGHLSLVQDASSCPSTSTRCAVQKPGPLRRGRLQLCKDRVHDFALWREELPDTPEYEDAGLIHGLRTVATPLLTPQKVFDRLYNAVHETAADHFGAFYSSEIDGIVTNPAFMVVHMDDHMVHRGHAVFDTVIICNGYLYQLKQHLERFKMAALQAGITLPLSDAAITRILLDTAAASKKMNGMVKFWVSSGRGGFGLSSKECIEPTFYALASSESVRDFDRTIGWSACASPIAPKSAPYGTIKSTNYMQNVLVKSHAEEQGTQVGLFVDENGFVLEGPNANFAMLTVDNVFVTPPFDNVIAGITIQRLMELIPEEHRKNPSDVIFSRIEQRPIHSDEVYKAKEAFLVSGNFFVIPLVSWNGQLLGDGTPGSSALALANILENDKEPFEGSSQHIEVPYGYVTGMKGQLI